MAVKLEHVYSTFALLLTACVVNAKIACVDKQGYEEHFRKWYESRDNMVVKIEKDVERRFEKFCLFDI